MENQDSLRVWVKQRHSEYLGRASQERLARLVRRRVVGYGLGWRGLVGRRLIRLGQWLSPEAEPVQVSA